MSLRCQRLQDNSLAPRQGRHMNTQSQSGRPRSASHTPSPSHMNDTPAARTPNNVPNASLRLREEDDDDDDATTSYNVDVELYVVEQPSEWHELTDTEPCLPTTASFPNLHYPKGWANTICAHRCASTGTCVLTKVGMLKV